MTDTPSLGPVSDSSISSQADMPADLTDPKYWRVRAEEVMSMARNLVEHGEPRDILYGIADEYERLAKITEKKNGCRAPSVVP